MTTATKNLENDHVNILRLIDVMEVMVERSTTDITHIETAVNLIKNFADGFHHAKEEYLLFPKMATKGFSMENGPIAVMLHDHTEGRNYVKGMSVAIENYKNGDLKAIDSIYSNMNGYGELLRAHIGKENNILFRMADNILSTDEQQALVDEFARIELESYSNNKIQEFIATIEELEGIYINTVVQ